MPPKIYKRENIPHPWEVVPTLYFVFLQWFSQNPQIASHQKQPCYKWSQLHQPNYEIFPCYQMWTDWSVHLWWWTRAWIEKPIDLQKQHLWLSKGSSFLHDKQQKHQLEIFQHHKAVQWCQTLLGLQFSIKKIKKIS